MERVLCIYALLVRVSDASEVANRTLTEITQKATRSLFDAFAHCPHVDPPDGAKCVWIDRDLESRNLNVYSCAVCGNIGTDWRQPNIIHGIREGFCSRGRFVCDACRDEQMTMDNSLR